MKISLPFLGRFSIQKDDESNDTDNKGGKDEIWLQGLLLFTLILWAFLALAIFADTINAIFGAYKDSAIVLATVVIAAFTVKLTGIGERQVRWMKQSDDIAHRALVVANRPALRIIMGLLVIEDDHPTIKFYIENTGLTDAKVTRSVTTDSISGPEGRRMARGHENAGDLCTTVPAHEKIIASHRCTVINATDMVTEGRPMPIRAARSGRLVDQTRAALDTAHFSFGVNLDFVDERGKNPVEYSALLRCAPNERYFTTPEF